MKLYYRKYGEGKPLIVLHGLFGLSDNLASFAKQMAEDYEVFVIDQRNHGQSPHSDDFSYGDMSNDLLEFIEDYELSDVALLGHSMGGKTAMNFACEHPEHVEKLIVVDIGPKAYPPHHEQILAALFSIDLQAVKTRKEAEAKMAETIKDFATSQFLLKNLYWETPEQLGWRMDLDSISKNIENVGQELDPRKSFGKPTLFMRGGLSNYILDTDWADIVKQFPQAKLVTIEGSGHWVHAEKPELFLSEVKKFLRQ